jgi:hypothetical protein
MRKNSRPQRLTLSWLHSIDGFQMKLPIACMECSLESQSVDVFARIEFRDDGRYEAVCPKGHKIVVVLQEQKFEILFDIGAYAVTDGYYREAVSSFTSALERFYEFFIRVVLYERGIDESILEDSWKLVSRQSERQLGAFIFLYTREFGTSPRILKEKEVHFRNDVIHRGKIPSKQEALEYGQIILDLIRPTLREIKQRYPKGIRETVFRHLREKSAEQAGTMTIATIVSLNREDENFNSRSLEQAVKGLKKW